MIKDNRNSGLMLFIYALTVFWGAFLLFQVQPLIGKYILPWFGGSPEVWTICMLCFQVLLLAGYGYAHLSTKLLGKNKAVLLHIILLVAAIVTLPVIPSDKFKPNGNENPIIAVLVIITSSAGLEFFVLSATGPLLQSWFCKTFDKEPYRLYALSNTGSLIALLSYPFIVEPTLTRVQQAWIWAGGLIIFSVLCGVCAVWFRAKCKDDKNRLAEPEVKQTDEKVSNGTVLLWVTMAMTGTVMLLAVTNKISQDISVVPVFWVVPLSIYLLSFIICFDHSRWYVQKLWLTALIASTCFMVYAKINQETIPVYQYIIIMCVLLFSGCMVCHGQLYSIRPNAKHLTKYYFMISIGGALGGIFVGVIAPLLFNTYCEIYLGLGACVLLTVIADKNRILQKSVRARVLTVLLVIVSTLLVFFNERKREEGERILSQSRNFFGVITVSENEIGNSKLHQKVMRHGTTYHGLEFFDEDKSNLATAYYSRYSGVGRALASMENKANKQIGVVGLGVGTIATYLNDGDSITFYEINKEVERLARKYFSYLEKCRGSLEVVIGDARVSMEKEEPRNYDLLVVDAFSSDAVPVHLLTKEAMEVYLKHIKENGILAFHVSNRHLSLHKVVFRQAEELGLATAWIVSMPNDERGIFEANWVLLGRNEEVLNHKLIKTAKYPVSEEDKNIRAWTDDYTNLFSVMD